MSPIFYKNKLVAFTACVFHHSDIGGRVSSDNHDVFEEGLFIPLVKLYDGGTLIQSVMDMIRWNVRTPDEVTGDIRSQIAANYVCAEKISQMLKETELDKKVMEGIKTSLIHLLRNCIDHGIEIFA
jgi:N-methylhydantoinase B